MLLFRHSLLKVIRLYQAWISPLLGHRCRFVPTCSDYAYQAVEQRGILRGLAQGFVRLMKCHPFHAGGYDPLESRT